MLRNNRPYKPKPPKRSHQMPIDRPKLKLMRCSYLRVHYIVLQEYVTKVFGFEFDYLFAEGVSNGECVNYTVGGIPPDWQRRADLLRKGQRTREVRLILAVLAQDGFIPKGKYTVDTHPLSDPLQAYRSLLMRPEVDLEHPAVAAFKQQYKDDPVVMEKIAKLDAAILQREQSHVA